MDKNQSYINNLKIEEVPWRRVITAYGRGTDFPKYFKTMWNMADMDDVKAALDEVAINIEHQSTLWHATPFAMIFLVRIFEHALDEMDENEVAYFIVEKLLELFIVVARCFHDGEGMEHAEPLPFFSDMINEQYLWAEEYSKEDDEKRYEEEGDELFPDGLFYSFWYYSYQTLLFCKPILGKIENPHIKVKAAELQELIS